MFISKKELTSIIEEAIKKATNIEEKEEKIDYLKEQIRTLKDEVADIQVKKNKV